MNSILNLPHDIARRRVMPTKDAAAFLGLSVATFRRERERKRLPPHIDLSTRRIGWRIGDLCDWQDARLAGLEWHEWKTAQAKNDNHRPN